MPSLRKPLPLLARLLLAAVTLQGVSGVVGGVGLVASPAGELLKLPVVWLEGSPFSDYLIPGLILLVVLGLFPLVAAAGLWARRRWGWLASLMVGVALIIWITVEAIVVGFHAEPPLQTVYGALGMVILVLGLLPPVRDVFAGPRGVRRVGED